MWIEQVSFFVPLRDLAVDGNVGGKNHVPKLLFPPSWIKVGTGSRVEEEFVWDLTEVEVPEAFGAGVVDGRCPEPVVGVIVSNTAPVTLSCRSRRTAPPETKSQQTNARRKRANKREESDGDLLEKAKSVKYIAMSVEIHSLAILPAQRTPCGSVRKRSEIHKGPLGWVL